MNKLKECSFAILLLSVSFLIVKFAIVLSEPIEPPKIICYDSQPIPE